MENQVMPAMRNMMINTDIDSDLRTLLDQGTAASDNLKDRIAQRYLAPYFGDNKESQMMLLDQILKASSDKEKIDLLKQFLEGIPASSKKFNPKAFLEDVSRNISATETPKISGLQSGEVLESDETLPLSAEPEFVSENFKIPIKEKEKYAATAKEDGEKHTPVEGRDRKPGQQRGQPMILRETYEQKQVESAKITVPEQAQIDIETKNPSSREIPESPMDAKEEREHMNKYGKYMEKAQEAFAKEVLGSRKVETEEKKQEKKKGISGALAAGLGSAAAAGGVTGMILWFT